jgi:8-hydroxy-5-deazaflavin:NADPH oxidoreductase
MNGESAIGIVGGTGPEGRGLAARFAAAGEHVVIGSRDADRGREAAAKVVAVVGGDGASRIEGATNAEAAGRGGLVVLAVPYEGQTAMLGELAPSLAGKIVVNVIAPLAFVDGRARPAPPSAGSAAEEAAALVPSARWVSGFHTLPARDLLRVGEPMATDALICGDDEDARNTVMELAAKIPGLRPVNAGRLESARCLEAATALLININRIYRAHGSIRIAGIHAGQAGT